MSNYQLGEQVWIISFEAEDDFYLLSKQTITDILEDKIECEDDFNTFHVDYQDIYRSKAEAFDNMIARLQQAKDE